MYNIKLDNAQFILYNMHFVYVCICKIKYGIQDMKNKHLEFTGAMTKRRELHRKTSRDLQRVLLNSQLSTNKHQRQGKDNLKGLEGTTSTI